MKQKFDSRIPRYSSLLTPTFNTLTLLGGSGSNLVILDKIIELQKIRNDIADIPHQGNERLSELAYQLAWARTYLKNFGVIS